MEFNLTEQLNLSNLCEGSLELEFQKICQEMIGKLDKDEVGKVKIDIDIEKKSDDTAMFILGYKITPKFPPRERISIVKADNTTFLTNKPRGRGPKVVDMGMFGKEES